MVALGGEKLREEDIGILVLIASIWPILMFGMAAINLGQNLGKRHYDQKLMLKKQQDELQLIQKEVDKELSSTIES
jgi:hypothetical protein